MGITREVMPVAIFAVLLSCAAWWTYFPVAKPQMEHAAEAATGAVRSKMMRDAYSMGHFPLLAGVIAYAVGLEEAIAHPVTPLPAGGRLCIALGLLLFLWFTGAAAWRMTGHLALFRMASAAAMAAGVYFVADVAPLVTLAIAFAGVAAIAGVDEHRAQVDKARPA